MARRNYGKDTVIRNGQPVSPKELSPTYNMPFRNKEEYKRKNRFYPGGASMPVNLPLNYQESVSDDRQCAGCYFNQEGLCSRWGAEIKMEYVCNSWANSEGKMETISLTQDTYTNNNVKEAINKDFNEFLKPPIDEDVDQFFQIYREIFYDIPKRGENSHETLLVDAKDYIEDYVDPKDTTILTLANKVESLQDQIAEEFNTQSHPFYPDGSILHVPYVYTGIMQNGKIRDMRWKMWEFYSKSRPEYRDEDGDVKSIGKIATMFDDMTVINGIPKGKPIRKEEDLNDYTFEEPSDVINFQTLREDMRKSELDTGEIEQLRLLLDEIEKTAPIPGGTTTQQQQQAMDDVDLGGGGLAYG